ncbi:Rne/Rng family ribonuclease [Nocardioides terrisoli]|uniref:Rne/Rng family ribonuclease n=1 Tax=Nocardioides terrisoli TaxID=3388267 RepID=UPI00287B6107|nr:Rne/Rng family ribonuclease [Nocardioides marmorisolisilvae]
MSDEENPTASDAAPAEDTARTAPGSRPESAPPNGAAGEADSTGPAPAKKAAKKAATKTATKKTTARKTAAKKTSAAPAAEATEQTEPAQDSGQEPAAEPPPAKKAAKKAAARPRKSAAQKQAEQPSEQPQSGGTAEGEADHAGAPMVLFKAPEKAAEKAGGKASGKSTAKPKKAAPAAKAAPAEADAESSPEAGTETGKETGRDGQDEEPGTDDQGEGGARRRRRRGGRRRRKPGGDDDSDSSADSSRDNGSEADDESGADGGEGGEAGSKRRRTRNRAPKSPEDEIASVSGSTRLEAKKQRRREGREAGRRRAPIVSEAEFLARREAVDRVMVIRQRDDLTQIGVLEDKVLVEHYVSRESQTSLIGNVYLGRVQNVLPSMEAAFIDIGKGRNAVLYAGEVNWSGLGHKDGQPRKIESVLTSGQTILVQVTKDPIGHKGARLTGQISLPGRFLVYVPDGTTSGISRKLPDTERNRLKTLLKEIVPDSAGVIVRTAAEGAAEDELTRDVERLTARWTDIEAKVKAGKAPELLYGEPDLTLKVVRDLFTEDFSRLIIEGDEAWDLVDAYVSHVAPDLKDRLERFEGQDPASAGSGKAGKDLFATYRVDEQIAKGLDRKVWLPSGGSLIIDRTEAMTVVDVNTGKFTGSGGNLEETVTKNNLEAAEEIVRQLRLRDIGGIIVVDFIDMVLESNRDLVLRRLVECLGRDRTRHQVAEVTSLGLVQMTRKRIGTGLLEAFSEECTHCKGRGVIVHDHPIETAGSSATDDEPRGRRSRSGRGRGKSGGSDGPGGSPKPEPPMPSPKDLAGTRPHPEQEPVVETDETPEVEPSPVEAVDAAVVDEPESPDTDAEALEPAAPVVVTSTRRRRTASRPAGPPSAETSTETGSEAPVAPAASLTAEAEPEEAGERSEDDASMPHVPVKKKGSRKR